MISFDMVMRSAVFLNGRNIKRFVITIIISMSFDPLAHLGIIITPGLLSDLCEH